MKTFLLYILISTSSLHADQIRAGMDIGQVKRAMTQANYIGGDREFIYGGLDSPTYSMHWSIGQGVLAATFDEKTKKVTALIYTLISDPNDPFNNSFQMPVKWFDSTSGQILITTNNGEQGVAE